MLKGLAITPPVLGRISIGKVIEKNGKRLPEKDDQFTITSQVQGKDGWLLHPLNEELRLGKDDKLRSIPVRLLFNEPELNFRADYTLFDRQSGRPVCVGNGETCKRVTQDGMQSMPCPSPDACPLAKGGACKPYGRLNVVIGDEDPLGSFVFRTTGFNSIRTLAARMHYFQAISGNRLACLPLELRLRGKPQQQVMIHSDQGSQFSSSDWQSFLKANNVVSSMSRRGNCHDNAVAESFFQLLKRERVRRKTYATRDEARSDIFDYIEMFYNPKRRHSSAMQLSPVEYEKRYFLSLESV
ncbi:IS3 family transposase [Pseudomonas asiatica]|uniref:recombination directionality factor n=1 Tax=Pseudomonas asiatica TaxID=2219225 RepID=UPI001E3B7829|nr:IS3 family transposase [Pseudomonas asiatica]